MKALVLTTDAFGGYGGIALYNRDFLDALCDYPDCSRVIAVPRLISRQCEPLPEGLEYVTEGTESKAIYAAVAHKSALKNRPFDLIVCGHLNLLPVAASLRFILKAPVLLLTYGIEAWKPSKSRLTNYLAGKVDAFASISDFTKKRFLSWSRLPDNKGFLLPNAIRMGMYGCADKSPALCERYGVAKKTVILTLGRLMSGERYKGIDEVLEAMPELAQAVPDITYIVGGEGSDRARLEDKAKALGLRDRVVFTGFIPEVEKAEHYRLADAYVMPSHGEGFGFVFLEAMACGVPALGSSIDGGREALLGGKLGLLVNPFNKTELKEGILKTLQRPKGTVPEGLDYFSFDNFKNRLHRIVGRVLAGF